MKFIKKLMVNSFLKIEELEDIEIQELKISTEEIKKINDKTIKSFITFIRNYKNKNVTLGNEKEIFEKLEQMIKKYKIFPKNKDIIKMIISLDEKIYNAMMNNILNK
jgi:hypothetical protein